MMDAIRTCVLPTRTKNGEVERRPTPIELLAQRAESSWKYCQRTSFPRLERLEKRTGRVVSIETASTEANLKKCHPQSQALLFHLLPAELRMQIYDYLAPDAFHHGRNDTHPSDGDGDHHLRNPLHTLSSTCRLAWREMNSLASHQTHHTFTMTSRIHGAESEEDRLYRFLTTLTPNNRQQLHGLQIFSGWKWLEKSLPQYSPLLLGYTGSCPEILVLTVRREDLWNDSHGVMSTDVSWLEALLSSSAMERLREVKLEVEAFREGEKKRTSMRLGPSVDQYRLLGSKIARLELRGWRSVEGRGRRFVLQAPSAEGEVLGRGLGDLAGLTRSTCGREKLEFVWTSVVAELTKHEVAIQEAFEESAGSWVVAARDKAAEKSMARRTPGVMARWHERKWMRSDSLLKFV